MFMDVVGCSWGKNKATCDCGTPSCMLQVAKRPQEMVTGLRKTWRLLGCCGCSRVLYAQFYCCNCTERGLMFISSLEWSPNPLVNMKLASNRWCRADGSDPANCLETGQNMSKTMSLWLFFLLSPCWVVCHATLLQSVAPVQFHWSPEKIVSSSILTCHVYHWCNNRHHMGS